MVVYIPSTNYIVATESSKGYGVVTSIEEAAAKAESVRIRNIRTSNIWYSLVVPENDEYINLDLAIEDQTDKVRESLKDGLFLETLFYPESKLIQAGLENWMESGTPRCEIESLIDNFHLSKYEALLEIGTGQDLMEYITRKNRQNDIGISSALLRKAGIKGTCYEDRGGKRYLLFDARHDSHILDLRHGCIEEGKNAAEL